jgi:hypothetical protein
MAGMLHVMWFQGGIKGYLKRQRAARKGMKAERKMIAEPVLDSIAELDPTIVATILPPGVSNSPSPQESPLVTPFTPGTTPMTLRDSYMFPTVSIPHIPALQMPSMPSMPTFSEFTAALPKSLAPDNMNFGFKDAVKSRWDEQKGRFAQARDRGMGLTLDDLGLRRRGREIKADRAEVQVRVHEVKDE